MAHPILARKRPILSDLAAVRGVFPRLPPSERSTLLGARESNLLSLLALRGSLPLSFSFSLSLYVCLPTVVGVFAALDRVAESAFIGAPLERGALGKK